MIGEYFEHNSYRHEVNGCYSMMPLHLYKQERDWTCSIACIRTITSGLADIGTEDEILEKYNFQIGPHYSKELKEMGLLNIQELEVKYGCMNKDTNKIDVSDIWELLKSGYRIMVNWLMSYDHWTVLIGWINNGDVEHNQLIYYCPYFDEVRLVRVGDFEVMWQSGQYSENGILKDYIAVKSSTQ